MHEAAKNVVVSLGDMICPMSQLNVVERKICMNYHELSAFSKRKGFERKDYYEKFSIAQ